MIEFLKLHIKDFKTYISADIDFSKFNSALVVGKRKDDEAVSNGTGKSTISDALDYVIFDEYDACCLLYTS